jgi:superfamily II DNA or RNA helicase
VAGKDLSPDVIFQGTLRDYQAPVVQKYLDHVQNNGMHSSNKSFGKGLLELPCAWGKTSASLYILSKLRKKTLVIVHAEFLMNQWIERIHQFLPNASIGKIQCDTVDIENKDIVLCMLQSLIFKPYDPAIFKEFGFTIIDEVHHISSKCFSNALFKVVTTYMLGLSATMERKDKTTYIIKMFLGEVIHKAEQRKDLDVEVRAVYYRDDTDAEFNKTILDWKGNPQNSSMISKLCSHNARTEFIIQTLCDFIRVDNCDMAAMKKKKLEMDATNPCCAICNKNNNYLILNTCCSTIKYCMICAESGGKRSPCPNCKKTWKFEQHYIENPYVKPLEHRHTIVMAHNLNILHYIYNKFVCKNLASVGFYVGGMNESELKKSEKKQVVLATFSMAQEGLDIASLNAEFLITPKTDITQCVGRILRAKHSVHSPVIYDFVDVHDVFKRQWAKRRAFYKKNNYVIVPIKYGSVKGPQKSSLNNVFDDCFNNVFEDCSEDDFDDCLNNHSLNDDVERKPLNKSKCLLFKK